MIASLSEVYTYDSLNQLGSYKLGTLNGTKTDVTGSPSNSQSWDYDAVGNWDSITTNSTTQTRSANKQNEITAVSGATTPTYDNNGNLTTDENNYRFVYDVWNKVVQVKNSSNVVIVAYGRDALHRHVTDTVGSTVTDRFFSGDWQLLETKVGSNTVTRNVWSPVYVDGLVLRDRDTDGNGSLDERLYALQDANWNTTALVNAGGTVQERYTYTPFGQVTFRDGSGSTLSGSAKDWVFLHHGGERIAAGDYEFRNRVYSPSLGRWLSNDPLGFNAGDQNWYRAVGNNPGNGGDPSGLGEIYPGYIKDLPKIPAPKPIKIPAPKPNWEYKGPTTAPGAPYIHWNPYTHLAPDPYTYYPGKWKICFYTTTLAYFITHGWIEVEPVPPNTGSNKKFGRCQLKGLWEESTPTAYNGDLIHGKRCITVDGLKVPKWHTGVTCVGECMAVWMANSPWSVEYYLPYYLGIPTLAGSEQIGGAAHTGVFPAKPSKPLQPINNPPAPIYNFPPGIVPIGR